MSRICVPSIQAELPHQDALRSTRSPRYDLDMVRALFVTERPTEAVVAVKNPDALDCRSAALTREFAALRQSLSEYSGHQANRITKLNL